ncbi:PDZ/DHR/GLGF domain protein [Dictyocaulus viviparus]|uniref:PDZ/DHR/GLGF domain protein n=1 Tax=Dictyocaulus viviparus TaxID=29172 RepID=A0A0D8XF88_DICVI|nr:PDZ/DHR/GLGF domain protein [Dictyocaulus viviparus]
MQCISDKGILDMDDKIIDVFDEIRDQILAIYDEQSPNGSEAVDAATRVPVVGRVRDSVVEIVNLDNPPSNGLRVTSSVADSGTAFAVLGQKQNPDHPVRSSLRSDSSTPSRHRVTLSPEVEKKLATGDSESRLSRSSARKSRLTDSFFDAKERLEDARQANRASPMAIHYRRPRAHLKAALDPENTVVTGVYDDLPHSSNGRLSAVQILRIEPDGRVGLDGRLKVGDNIVEIDSRPVYQMSVVRARAYLSELQCRTEPSLTVARPIASFCDVGDSLMGNQPTSSLHNRPILSALQQANTQHIGHTKVVDLKKTPNGFGFTVTGRETAKGERLFYIGTVKPNGVALGHLRAGDRLLELNGEPTAELTQAEVVDRLKQANVGETVSFLVSRVGYEDEEKRNHNEFERRPRSPTETPAKNEIDEKFPPSTSATSLSNLEVEELELVIPLNDTGSAGLGVSLKARVTVRTNGTRQDCGIFIKNVLHGGAAHKDGRLRVNDRIIGIEELRLDGETNATASEAVSRRLKAIGPTAKHVRLLIRRTKTSLNEINTNKDMLSSVDDSTGVEPRSSESLSSAEKQSPTESMDPDPFERMDESDSINITGLFNREAPTRKSMSEKRGMGASVDPHHIKIFQNIKHQRQTSAPHSEMTTSLSFHGQSTGRSASQRAAARARSHSVHPRAPGPASPKIMKMSAASQALAPSNPPPSNVEKRRSWSVESINQDNQSSSQKHVAVPYRGALTSDSFRHATNFDVESPTYSAGSQVLIKPRSTSREKNKQRRKSLGGFTAMKSFLGIGGKNRDENVFPQKTDIRNEEAMLSKESYERRKVLDYYEHYHEKEAEENRGHHHLSTPLAGRREAQRTYVSPNYNCASQLSSPPSPLIDLPLIVANSRFYCSLRARPEYQPVHPTTNPTISSTDITCIATQRNQISRMTTSEFHPIITALPTPPAPTHNLSTVTQCQVQNPFTVVLSPLEVRLTKNSSNMGRSTGLNNHRQVPFQTTAGCSILGSPIVERESEDRPLAKRNTLLRVEGRTTLVPGPVTLPKRDMDLSTHLNFTIAAENTESGVKLRSSAHSSHRTRKFRRGVQSYSRDDFTTPAKSPFGKCINMRPTSLDHLLSVPQFPDSYVAQTLLCDQITPSGFRNSFTVYDQTKSQTLKTYSRIVTAIEDPVDFRIGSSSDYCRVWKNCRSGFNLPSQKP